MTAPGATIVRIDKSNPSMYVYHYSDGTFKQKRTAYAPVAKPNESSSSIHERQKLKVLVAEQNLVKAKNTEEAVAEEQRRLEEKYGKDYSKGTSFSKEEIAFRTIEERERLRKEVVEPSKEEKFESYIGPRPSEGDPFGVKAVMKEDETYSQRNKADEVAYPAGLTEGGAGKVKMQEAFNRGYTGYTKVEYGGGMGGETKPEAAITVGAKQLFQRRGLGGAPKYNLGNIPELVSKKQLTYEQAKKIPLGTKLRVGAGSVVQNLEVTPTEIKYNTTEYTHPTAGQLLAEVKNQQQTQDYNTWKKENKEYFDFLKRKGLAEDEASWNRYVKGLEKQDDITNWGNKLEVEAINDAEEYRVNKLNKQINIVPPISKGSTLSQTYPLPSYLAETGAQVIATSSLVAVPLLQEGSKIKNLVKMGAGTIGFLAASYIADPLTEGYYNVVEKVVDYTPEFKIPTTGLTSKEAVRLTGTTPIGVPLYLATANVRKGIGLLTGSSLKDVNEAEEKFFKPAAVRRGGGIQTANKEVAKLIAGGMGASAGVKAVEVSSNAIGSLSKIKVDIGITGPKIDTFKSPIKKITIDTDARIKPKYDTSTNELKFTGYEKVKPTKPGVGLPGSKTRYVYQKPELKISGPKTNIKIKSPIKYYKLPDRISITATNEGKGGAIGLNLDRTTAQPKKVTVLKGERYLTVGKKTINISKLLAGRRDFISTSTEGATPPEYITKIKNAQKAFTQTKEKPITLTQTRDSTTKIHMDNSKTDFISQESKTQTKRGMVTAKEIWARKTRTTNGKPMAAGDSGQQSELLLKTETKTPLLNKLTFLSNPVIVTSAIGVALKSTVSGKGFMYSPKTRQEVYPSPKNVPITRAEQVSANVTNFKKVQYKAPVTSKALDTVRRTGYKQNIKQVIEQLPAQRQQQYQRQDIIKPSPIIEEPVVKPRPGIPPIALPFAFFSGFGRGGLFGRRYGQGNIKNPFVSGRRALQLGSGLKNNMGGYNVKRRKK